MCYPIHAAVLMTLLSLHQSFTTSLLRRLFAFETEPPASALRFDRQVRFAVKFRHASQSEAQYFQVEITRAALLSNRNTARCKCSRGGLSEMELRFLHYCLISLLPSEEWLDATIGHMRNGLMQQLASISAAANFVVVIQAQRGCVNSTDDVSRGPTQVGAPETAVVSGTKLDEIVTTNVSTPDVQVSKSDGITQIIRSEDITLGTNREEGPEWGRLPPEITGRILDCVEYECIFQLKSVSKKLKSFVERSQFHKIVSLREKVKLTASYFFIKNEYLQWAGFDLSLKKWRRLPTLDLNFLPADCRPDPDLFKEFLVCSAHGLLCINFSKSPDMERMIVLNPMSRTYRELPPMACRRNPVFMHMLVDPVSQCYRVIAAGSSKSGDEDLSRVTEVYDSRTGKWKRTGDFPGPAYALNEFQSGVYQVSTGIVLCIGFVEENDQLNKGILGYDVEEGTWSEKWTHMFSFCTLKSTILQLVEHMGEIYLFSERENGRSTEHYIDWLKWTSGNGDEKNTCTLINIVQKQKVGGRSLEVYPQSVCVPFSDGHLCILDAIDHTGVVHDIRNHDAQIEFPLEALPEQGFRGELGFFSLNAMSFMVEPNFGIEV